MEDGNQENEKDKETENEDEEAYKEAEAILKANGIAGKMLSRAIKGMKAKGRQGGKFIQALAIMGEATKQSQLAEKAYWDYNTDKPKTDADYKRAEELVQRAINNLDRAMAAFPATIGTLEPVRKKLMIQWLDIQYQRKGEIKDPADLEAEYDELYQLPTDDPDPDPSDEAIA